MTDRVKLLRDAFAVRLERVRGDMTDDDFERLVDDVLATAQRFEEIERRESKSPPPEAGKLHTFNEPEVQH